jgi:uncharacterized repeat protein (TIGR01451 family)
VATSRPFLDVLGASYDDHPTMRSNAAAPTLATISLGLMAMVVITPLASGSNWRQFNFDSQHSGNNPEETTINTGNVCTLHVLYQVTLPGVADGAPALLQGVSTSQGVKDLLFLVTRDGRLLALDAATGSTVWSRQPAASPRYTTSSPAIDPNGQFVYAYGLDGKAHKYGVSDGAEIVTGGWPELATLKPTVEKGSSALAVATDRNGTSYLYVSSGGYPGDAGDYQGHVTAINLATGAQNVFNTNCSDHTAHFVLGGSPDCASVQTAVWARAGVVYDSINNRILLATGNGVYDAHTGGHNWGDSILAINPDGTGSGVGGTPLDSYTPTEFQTLQDRDDDLGSTTPAILPFLPAGKASHLAVQSGKDALLRLIDLDNMSGMNGPGHLSGELQRIAVPQGSEVLTTLAVWVNPTDRQTWCFVANGAGISGLQLLVDGAGNPSIVSRWTSNRGGTSPIVANGIVYYVSGGNVWARDPLTGNVLFHDTSIGGVHWESPIVINGRLHVTDENGKLWAYAAGAGANLSIALAHSGNFTQGDTGKRYAITVTNSGNAPTSGTVTVTDTLPAGLVATGFGGTGWGNCTATPSVGPGTLSCSRSDVLAGGSGYPPIAVTVNVASSATPSTTNSASVSFNGPCGAAMATTSDPTVIQGHVRHRGVVHP